MFYLTEFGPTQGDLISLEEAKEMVEKEREIIKALKGMEAVGDWKPISEESPAPSQGASLSDVINLLLRIEERIERIEQKLDTIPR
jgi:hypothetical protein